MSQELNAGQVAAVRGPVEEHSRQRWKEDRNKPGWFRRMTGKVHPGQLHRLNMDSVKNPH